jgi:ribosomal protein L37E
MATKANKCSKCGQPMEFGFTPEYHHRGSCYPSTWVAGVPEKSFFLGTKTKGKKTYAIGAWRCTHCGLLEFYANHEIKD